MRKLRMRQIELLRRLADAQELVPKGQKADFLTATSFEGTDIILPSGENIAFNRYDLDELVDQGLVRITLVRQFGDINGHVTYDGFELLESISRDTLAGPGFVHQDENAFEDPQDVPTVFISYSHDSDEHKRWVRVGLAERLMAAGVRVILDQWHLKIGENLPYFMEKALRCDFVLIVCTPRYARRGNERDGGVGYETSIITAELVSHRPSIEPKFLPLLRGGNLETSRPAFLKAALAADLRDSNPNYEKEFLRLLRQLYREPELTPPPLGKKPKFDSGE